MSESNRRFQPGQHVIAEKLDGSQDDAVVVGYHDKVAGAFDLFADDDSRQATTLARYWGDIEQNEPVVAVRFAKGVTWDGEIVSWSVGTYDFPESQLSEVDGDE